MPLRDQPQHVALAGGQPRGPQRRLEPSERPGEQPVERLVVLLRGQRQHQYPRARVLVQDRLRGLDALHLGGRQVDHRHIRVQLVRQLAHAGAQERVVVGEQQAHVEKNAHRRLELAYAGTAPRQGAIRRSALRIARVAGERLSV